MLLKYLTMKLNMFLGSELCIFVQIKVKFLGVFPRRNFGNTPRLFRFSVTFLVLSFLIDIRTSFVELKLSNCKFIPLLVSLCISLMSAFGDCFKEFLIVTWHCMNLVEGKITSRPNFSFDNKQISSVPHTGNSSQRHLRPFA